MKPLKKPCRDRGNRLDQLISADKTIGTEIGTDFLSSNIKWVYYRTNKLIKCSFRAGFEKKTTAARPRQQQAR